MERSGPWPAPTLAKAPSPAGEELAAWAASDSHIIPQPHPPSLPARAPPLIYSTPVSKRATTALGWEAHSGITIFHSALKTGWNWGREALLVYELRAVSQRSVLGP